MIGIVLSIASGFAFGMAVGAARRGFLTTQLVIARTAATACQHDAERALKERDTALAQLAELKSERAWLGSRGRPLC